MLNFKAQFDWDKFCTAWSIKSNIPGLEQKIKHNQKMLKVKEESNRRGKPVT